eukprot:scaffold21078_cov112-Isochrysis_galbana.AAC.2
MEVRWALWTGVVGRVEQLGAGWASRGTFRGEHDKLGRAGCGQVGQVGGGASGQDEQCAGTSGRLRAGCGRNVGVDWAESSLHREKWQAPLARRKRRDGCQKSGWAPKLGCFEARWGSWWEEVSWAG